MNVLICDDNRNEIEKIKECLAHINNDIPVKFKAFTSAMETYQYFNEKRKSIDLCIFDVEIGNENGIELAKQIKIIDQDSVVILISAYEKYLIKGYEALAYRFVIKPFKREELEAVIYSAYHFKEKRNKKITFSFERKYITINYKDINYIQSAKKKVEIQTDDENYVTRTPLKELYEQLDKTAFCLISNYAIVNMDKIKIVDEDHIVMDNGALINISRRCRKDFKNSYGQFIKHRR